MDTGNLHNIELWKQRLNGCSKIKENSERPLKRLVKSLKNICEAAYF